MTSRCLVGLALFAALISFAHPCNALERGFIENHGQTGARVRFSGAVPGMHVYFTQDAVVFGLKSRVEPLDAAAFGPACAVYVRFPGVPSALRIEGRGRISGRTNVFQGNDPARWQRDLSSWSEVVYRDVRPGVDLVFSHGDGAALAYHIEAAPGATVPDLGFTYDGVDAISHDGSSRIDLATSAGSLTHFRPGAGRSVGRFERSEASTAAGAAPGASPAANPASLLWSTFLGGSGDDLHDGDDYIHDIVRDSQGNIVVVGQSWAPDFPTSPGAYQVSSAGYIDAFIAKLDPTCSSLIWSTLLGSGAHDPAYRVALDAAGNVVVAGLTGSAGFPHTPGVFDMTYVGPAWDIFVSKLDASGGSLVWSGFLGGDYEELPSDLAVGTDGEVYVTGSTESPNFPATGHPIQAHYNGSKDGFVSKISANGGAFTWSTFLGGFGRDSGHALALDADGNVFVAGATQSLNFPRTPDAYDRTLNAQDVWIAKIHADGQSFYWSTLLGGTGGETSASITIDAAGNPIIVGNTSSLDFPTTPGAYRRQASDGFICSLNASGSDVLWSSYFIAGGTPRGLAMNAQGHLVVAGTTSAGFMPVTPSGYQTSYNGGDTDGFIAVFDMPVTTLLWATFIGASGADAPEALSLSPAGDAIIAGTTNSSDYPTTAAAFQTTPRGGKDGYISCLSFSGYASVESSSPALGTRVIQVLPNPSVQGADFRFALAGPSSVSVRIFDTSGRLVRAIAGRFDSIGPERLHWDGRTVGGAIAGPGVYLYELRMNDQRQCGKLVISP